MKKLIPNPVNLTQTKFNVLCELGGGAKGGPARIKVLHLLKKSGQNLNKLAYSQAAEHLKLNSEGNPWHTCFAIGLSWGHLAKLEEGFSRAVVGYLANPNGDDLKEACSYHLERGPTPIEQSLIGAHNMFSRVTLPRELPSTLKLIYAAQEKWFVPLAGRDRPPYIGNWNSTAMFMVALFAQPELAATQTDLGPLLPPGGPIHRGLQLLHSAGILNRPAAGSELDDGKFESGLILESNSQFVEIRKGVPDWSMIDVHSGLYMLGTKHKHSAALEADLSL